MRKNHTSKSQPQTQKGRVLARALAEELRYVQGGGIGTFTLPPDPDWPADLD